MLVAPTQQQEADTATGDPSTLVFVSTTLAGTAHFYRIRQFEMFTVAPPAARRSHATTGGVYSVFKEYRSHMRTRTL